MNTPAIPGCKDADLITALKRPRKSLVKKPEVKLLEDKIKKLESEGQRHQKQIKALRDELTAKEARIQELEATQETTHKAAEVTVQTAAAAKAGRGRGAKTLTEADIAAQQTTTTTPPTTTP